MTMAMQRARPIRIRPVMYSGLSLRKITASANISTGPMIQFWMSEIASTRLSSNTRGSSSYRTRASGGYIIRIKPIAIGIFVVPIDKLSMARGRPENVVPNPTPSAMARKIHKVR